MPQAKKKAVTKKTVKKVSVKKKDTSKRREIKTLAIKNASVLIYPAFLFDTETTGLVENRTIKLDKQPEIIEFYGCLADLADGRIVKEFHTFIKPKQPLSDTPPPRSKKTITQITGITNEMLADAPRCDEVIKTIIEMPTMSIRTIAHNLSFDKDMVEIEGERHELPVIWSKEMICTVEQTIHLKGFRLSMSNLHQLLFNEAFEGAHRANVDVAALLRCSVELHKRGLI